MQVSTQSQQLYSSSTMGRFFFDKAYHFPALTPYTSIVRDRNLQSIWIDCFSHRYTFNCYFRRCYDNLHRHAFCNTANAWGTTLSSAAFTRALGNMSGQRPSRCHRCAWRVLDHLCRTKKGLDRENLPKIYSQAPLRRWPA